MEKNIINAPEIYDQETWIGYGGNQDWFPNKWATKAGCASVSATNVIMYYTRDVVVFDKKEYLNEMEKMFVIMEPKKRGFPYAFLYARRTKAELAKRGLLVQYKINRNPYPKDAIATVKESIDAKNPIGLLILTHRRRKVRDDLWHWVTIFGYVETPKGMDIVFSDCGEKKQIPAEILFEKHRCNVIKMVTFYR